MNKADRRLCEIFKRILASDDAELRDLVVTYIATTDYVEAVDILLEYAYTEPLAWLRAYALQVVEHLEKFRDGIPSKPPILTEMDDTEVGIKRRKHR